MPRLILKGGLGNQMFQYASTFSLARELNTEVLIDLSFLNCRPPIKGFTLRDYSLHKFSKKLKTTTVINNKFLDAYLSYPLHFLNKKINPAKYYTAEDPYFLDKNFFSLNNNTIIDADLINFRYFNHYFNELSQIYELNKFKKDNALEKEITNTNSISLYIRKGDFLTAKHSKIYVDLKVAYYEKACEIIGSAIKNPHYFVFTNADQSFYKKIRQLRTENTTVIPSTNSEEYDMFLMNLCEHNIISNSTYSFWPAYLSSKKDRLVIAPKKWTYIYSDFAMPEFWIKINN